MQDSKRFEDRHPAARPGLSGALGPLRRCGEEEQGGAVKACKKRYMLARVRGQVKTKGRVKGRLR